MILKKRATDEPAGVDHDRETQRFKRKSPVHRETDVI
jgi:hypothetical protein